MVGLLGMLAGCEDDPAARISGIDPGGVGRDDNVMMVPPTTPPPNCEGWMMDPCNDGDDYPTMPGGSGPTGGSGGSGGSGGASPQPTPAQVDSACAADAANGTVCESVDRPECTRVSGAYSDCVTRPPSLAEWEILGAIINRITTSSDYCRGAKAQAVEMYAAGREGGRIVLWDGRNYRPGTGQSSMYWGYNRSDIRGRNLQLDSYLAVRMRSLVAHEALHAYLHSINSPIPAEEQEPWIRARESECAG
jgi:hypothetical protein